jgi:hypothetical protein
MLEIPVLGNKWKVSLHEEDRYVRRHGDDTAGITIPTTNEIHFNEEEFSREVVIHELCHAFFAETCTGSANLNAGQTEEVFCDMIGKHGDRILRLSRKVYKELKDQGSNE